MDVGRGGGSPLRARPPPKRTYGSKQGSRRLFGSNNRTTTTGVGKSSVGSTEESSRSTPPAELENGRLDTGETCRSSGLMPQQSAVRFSGAVGGGARSSEDILRLVRAAGEGGESGRTSAIALAQACKSRETREAMLSNAGDILSELTSVMLASLRSRRGHQHHDKATVHGLAVAMFVLSKDRAMAKAFSASDVSTLAVLIETNGRQEDPLGTCAAAGSAGSAARIPSVQVSAGGRRPKPASLMDTMGTIYEHGSNSVESNGHKGACPFDMRDEDEDNDEGDAPGRVGGRFSVGGESSGAGPAGSGKRSLPAHGAQPHDHGSANAMVRARMLLDIADIVPWGMANRHLVSAADLGLATLLNVAAQACPESVEGGGRVAADGAAGGESVDEEFSTQGSMGSQSEPGSVLGALANGQADSSDASSANSNNTGVVPELSRLAPTGFLLHLVVGATAVLADLSVASLRSLHQLLLALRLLDLATLVSSGEGDGAAAKATAGAAKPPRQSPSHPYAELTGALLLVVAKCQPFCSDGVPARHHWKGKAPDRRFGDGVDEQPTGSQQPVVGNEVAAKVHECLLAALRVLINVTHHDARVCAEVAARRGLETLMCCLARSCCGSQGGDSDGSSRGPLTVRAKSDLDLLGDEVNDETIPETGLEEDGSVGGAGSGAGDFDAQVLAMSALINCVELKESADNCAAIASLAVHPPAAWAAGGKAVAGNSREHRWPLPGVGDCRCLAPEFLAKLLTRYTRNFAHQLEADRPGENDDDEGPAPRPPSGAAQHEGGVMAGGSSAAAPATHSSPSAVAATPQKGDNGEQSLSHAEGTYLVLGGHCALLLGLLVRDQERNRRLALPVLPNGDPTLIVRVLEAFMALQFQAGVLTEELVLAVQGLVEELEGLDALPAEEGGPVEPVADKEPASVATFPAAAAAAASVSAAATTPQQGGLKRPRDPSSRSKLPPVEESFATPPSGQSGGEAGGGDDSHANDSSLSVKSSPTAAQEESESSLWMTQSTSRDATPPPKRLKPSEPSSSSPTRVAAPEEERQATATPNKSSSTTCNPTETPPSRSQTPGSTPKSSSSWRAGITSIAERIGLGFRGRSATGSKSWFGGGPKLQSFRNRNAYGSQTWRKASSRSLAGSSHSSPSYGQAGEKATAGLTVDRVGKPSRGVFDILSDESEADLPDAWPVGGAASGVGEGGVVARSDRSGALAATAGGAANSIAGGGVGPRSDRSSTVAATAAAGAAKSVAEGGAAPRSGRSSNVATTASSFDIDDWSDSSNESPGQRKPGEEAKTKGTRVPRCQLQALGGSRGSARGCGARDSGVSGGGVAARSVFDKRSRRSPSPSPPPAAAPATGRNYNASRGAATHSGLPGVAKGGIKTAPATSIAKAKGGVTSQPTEEVGARAKLGLEHGRSAGVSGLANGARPTVKSGDSARGGRVGGVKSATRRVLGVDGRSKGRSEKPASRNVFEMSDEDESD